MIKYMLVTNPITAKTKTYYAVVTSPETKELEDIITHMIAEGSGLTRPQALAYFERLTQSVMYFANQGHNINTPLFRVRPTIKGRFNSIDDRFDPQRHQIKFRASEGQQLQKMPVTISKIVKVTNEQFAPKLISFIDINNEKKKNNTLSVGGIGVLKGKHLRFDEKDERLGVFFAPVHAPKVRIRASIYSHIQPSAIHFQVPSLEAGEYFLFVHTLSSDGINILIGSLKENLIVLLPNR